MGAKGSILTPDLKRNANNQIWFRFRISVSSAEPRIDIRDFSYTLVQTLSGYGQMPAGNYDSRSRAIFWNREVGGGPSLLASGTYYAELLLDGSIQDLQTFLLD